MSDHEPAHGPSPMGISGLRELVALVGSEFATRLLAMFVALVASDELGRRAGTRELAPRLFTRVQTAVVEPTCPA